MRYIKAAKIKMLLQNLALLMVSLILCILIIEVGLFRFFPQLLPLKLQGYVNHAIRVLSQNTKAHALPSDYIAVMGDSYAQGQGDALLEANPNSNYFFHSVPYIYSRTKIDIISFGVGGSGSLRALIREPISVYEYLNSMPLYSLQRPKHIFIYFHEGNDLSDNLIEIRKFPESGRTPGAPLDPVLFESFVREKVLKPNQLYRLSKSRRLIKKMILPGFIEEIVTGFTPETAVDKGAVNTEAGHINRVNIGGKTVTIPDALQSPEVTLSKENFTLAFNVFERALLFMSGYFPGSGVSIVYVPSVLSCYEIASDNVSVQISTNDTTGMTVTKNAVIETGENTFRTLSDIALRYGIEIIDSRPFIKKASSGDLVHGPKDWKHFNRLGYTALGDAVLSSRFFSSLK